ncbi:MAG TPA: hypothetical protein VLF61_00195 [Rhabdochlamydiaceae bacterium]|nr:hypothetical protein [Rhabdochlamydiaceae bacterium]
MTKIRLEDLLNFNARGYIPGPGETEEQFLKRIEILNHFYAYPPAEIDCFLTDGDWKEARALTDQLFGFSIDWAVAYYSDKKLPFFQGAATWLIEKQGIQIPMIQLKTRLEQAALYKMYHKKEILAHESVHAARMAFHAPRFEEIFAYMSSRSPVRKWLGPMFQKSWESYLFFILLIGSVILQLFVESTLFFLFPWLYFAFLCGRLIFLRFKLGQCLKKLKIVLLKPEQALPMAYRLTDQEILLFAKATPAQIKSYCAEQKELRWKLLHNLR